MIDDDLTLDFVRTEAATWGAYALVTAWFAFPWGPPHGVPGWVHVALAAAWGLYGWAYRSPYAAGISGACLGSLALRTATADYGLPLALVGALVSALAVNLLLVAALEGEVGLHDGRVPARYGCSCYALATCCAAVWTGPCAGLVARMVG